MAALLLEWAIRAMLIASTTAVLLWALRIKTASARHAVWTAVLIGMLLLPGWSIAGLKMPVRVLPPPDVRVVSAPIVSAPASIDRAEPAVSVESSIVDQAQPFDGQRLLMGVYLLGMFALLARLMVGTLRAHQLRRRATIEDGRTTSALCTTPITVGFVRPILVLPASWPRWPSAQLHAVLTHEREHARRHDPLVQWVALLNRAVFWFHPLSWWLERRLATLAEEACDAAVLAAGHSPQDYSAYLLDMARSIARSGGRVRPLGMAMPGSGLRSRLTQILDQLPMKPVSRLRVTTTVVVCALSSALFAAGTLTERSKVSQKSHTFDVVSIKPCASVESAETGRGAGPNLAQVSPGRAFWACVTVASLIDQAYAGADFPLLNVAARPLAFENRRGNTEQSHRVRGGPSWISSDRFAVEVTAPVETINGRGNLMRLPAPMNSALRAMLADRFQLNVQRATEEQPMYALTVARGGLKIKTPAAGDCTVWVTGMPRSPQRGDKPYCGNITHTAPLAQRARMEAGDDHAAIEATPGANRRLEYSGVTLAAVAKDLATVMDRFVIDKTDAAGDFLFAVEFSADETTPGFGGMPGAAVTGPRIFQALEALGLRLEPTKGPAEYLQIDTIKQPSPDTAMTQNVGLATPQFDVVSIKPCTDMPAALVTKRGGLKTIGNTENRLYLECISLESLVDLAYNRGGDFVMNEHIDREVRGGPDWIRSDRFTIEATAAGSPGATLMMGAMLRPVLEDRFQLRAHREADEIPMYALSVAKGGLKIKPMAASDCISDESGDATPTPAAFAAGKKPMCGSMRGQMRGSIRVWDVVGMTLQELGDVLDTDRQVLDQTGVKDRFIIHLEYERDAKVLDGVNVFAALEAQLGLTLGSTKGPHTFTVVDRAEKPRPDAPAESMISTSPAAARARR